MSGWGPKGGVGGGGGGPAVNVVPIGQGQVPGDTEVTDVVKSVYNEISAVPAAVESTILTFVVPATPVVHAVRIEFGGTNIGQYKLYFDATVQNQYITWWNGSGLSAYWDFKNIGGTGGLLLAYGSVLRVKVIHNRPYIGDYFCRLQYVEIN